MLAGILFFGASSSQAVHPDRAAPSELALGAAKGILKDARELVMASVGTGARITSTRTQFSIAQEKLKANDAAATAALANAAVRAVAAPNPVLANLRTGFEFLVAANAAEQAGVDVRHAVSVYEAATAGLGQGSDVFGSSWSTLGDALRAADGAAKARYKEVLKLLQAPARALDLLGEV
jgi:hypothetical protein